MYYIKKDKITVLSHSEIRDNFIDISFPQNMSDELLQEYGVYKVTEVIPSITSTQKIVYATDPILLNGVWTLQHSVVEKTSIELESERKALVPQSITKLQAMRAMKQTDVNTMANTTMWTSFQSLLASNVDANDEWALALDLQRNHPLVLALTPALGKTDIQIDDLFILASTL